MIIKVYQSAQHLPSLGSLVLLSQLTHPLSSQFMQLKTSEHLRHSPKT